MGRSKQPRHPRQLELPLRTRGGRRAGAGRKREPGAPARTPHRARPTHSAHHPVHVTLRVNRRIPSLRRLYATCERAIRAHRPEGLRITDFSVQSNHVHMIVEAADRRSLSRGIHGFEVRLARALNRRLERKGNVFADRWHGHALRSPREVRNALVYVLMNAKKHGHTFSNGVDPCSSAPWFPGFLGRQEGARSWLMVAPRVMGTAPVAKPGTWLREHGWTKWGLIGREERPSQAG